MIKNLYNSNLKLILILVGVLHYVGQVDIATFLSNGVVWVLGLSCLILSILLPYINKHRGLIPQRLIGDLDVNIETLRCKVNNIHHFIPNAIIPMLLAAYSSSLVGLIIYMVGIISLLVTLKEVLEDI